MPLSFPSNPTTGQTSTQNGRTYIWSGSAWEFSSVGSGQDTALRAFFVPPAPTNVTGTAGNAQVSLTWTAPTVLSQTPITDYVVQYSSNSGSTWTTFTDGTSTSASATVTGLTNGTAYTFRVAGVNGVGQGAWSTASSAVTPTAGEPYWSNVTLLIHADTSITDVSSSPKSINPRNCSVGSTAKFGAGSVQFPGSSFLQLDGFPSLGTANFTVEMWLYPTNLANRPRMAILGTPNQTNGLEVVIARPSTGGWMRVGLYGGASVYFSDHGMTDNNWHHFAVCRSGNQFGAFVNGTPLAYAFAEAGWPTTPDFQNSTLLIGSRWWDADEEFWGFMDEIRITSGVSRYTIGTAFTPPSAAFLGA